MSPEQPLRAGEAVLLIDERRGKRHLVTLRLGQAFHSDRGWVGHDALIGAVEGVTVTTSLGARYLALRPTLAEYVLEMPRGAQVIYPKDLATICLFADIGPGQTVCEAGLGSGALTMVLLRAVGPTGHVVSYEMREEFARRARRNIEVRLGPDVPLTVRLQDVYAGFVERGVDRVVLDLPEPWQVVEPAAEALRSGGIFCAYVPTIPQAQRTHETLAAHAAAIAGGAAAVRVHRAAAHRDLIRVLGALARPPVERE